MSTATLREIKNIFENSGLHAEFRVDFKNIWSDVIKQGRNVPALYMEHLVDYQTVHFNNLKRISVHVSVYTKSYN